jgi:secretion/DNA translocation related TadE-like protein
VSVVAAGVLVTLLVCTMGVSDIAKVLGARALARTAADAAALAAAQELAAPGGADPETAAGEFAVRNGARLTMCTCPAGGSDAVVSVERSVDGLWLVPGTFTLTAEARAVVDLP